jgi:fructokinase
MMPMMHATRVLGIGELLWDRFPDGPRLGGAPFNVTASLRRLGHPAQFLTAVGDDELGRAAMARAADLGVDPSLVTVSRTLPTGTVAVVIDPAGGHRFEIETPAAYERLALTTAELERVATEPPSGFVFGTLAQRFAGNRHVTRRLVAALPHAVRLYDVNLREGCWTPGLVAKLLPLATAVKVNEEEATILGRILGVDAAPAALGERLARDAGVGTLSITRGRAGAAMWRDGRVVTVEGRPVTVADTVGAGDAFAAGLLHGLLEGWPATETLDLANRLGALVASRPGALPPWTLQDLVSRG